MSAAKRTDCPFCELEYSKLLPDVVTIADEVDAQLKQQMLRYMEANAIGNKPNIH